MRCIVVGIFLCATVSTISGKPVEPVTVAPPSPTTTEKGEKENHSINTTPTTTHLTSKESTTAVTSSTEKKATDKPLLSNALPAETTTKTPDSSHTITAKSASTTAVPSLKAQTTQKPSDEIKASTTSKSSIGSSTAKPVKEVTTKKPQSNCCGGKKEEPKHKSEEVENPISDLLNEGKIIVFDGICGPEGCSVKGDIYDDMPRSLK